MHVFGLNSYVVINGLKGKVTKIGNQAVRGSHGMKVPYIVVGETRINICDIKEIQNVS